MSQNLTSSYGLGLVLADFVVYLFSWPAPIHGGSNQQVMQPVVVILKSIEILKRRRPSWIVEFSSAAVGMKIPNQGHRTQLQTG